MMKLASQLYGVFLAIVLLATASAVVLAKDAPKRDEKAETADKITGMYVHQHWSYNHPYAARTWTLEDWEGYLDGLHKLGFNAVLYWPVMETIPDPPTPSDIESLERFAKVIDIARKKYGMKVFITMSPNVVPKNDVARRYTWEKRPFFACDDRINPRDVTAVAKIVDQRKKLITYLKEVDGIMLIDSDPGGWPGSTNIDFVGLLGNYRTMFDEIRPGIELYYWSHAGWEAYSRYYATAQFEFGKPEEFSEMYKFLNRQKLEPWGIATGHLLGEPAKLGLESRVLSFRYGAVESEPSFPLTNFGSDQAWEAANEPAPRGVMGNAQSHCMQIPYTFAFARGNDNLPIEKEDYVELAERLITGQGETIYAAWNALGGTDPQAMRAAAESLASIDKASLQPGPLRGLLFGEPGRFINDLVLQLHALADLEDFRAAALADPQEHEKVTTTFAAFIDSVSKWQECHGYSGAWSWPRLDEALLRIDSNGRFAKMIELRTTYRADGETPFDRVKNGYLKVETFTPDLIEAMRKRLAEMQSNKATG
jgi:hypothetical protein